MAKRPEQLDVYRTAIPMRDFEHAAASRELAEAIVVRATLPDGTVGWGETLPRDYVTGETFETVPDDIERIFWPALSDDDPEGKALPTVYDGRNVTAARCAVELALRDAWDRLTWNRRSWRAELTALRSVRASGVLGGADPAKTTRELRRMKYGGLRDIKLKLGLGNDVDRENLRVVHRVIGKSVAAGKRSLRVDVNGGWPADETPDRVAALERYGVCAVEQPFFGPVAELIDVAQRCRLPLMADESVILAEDALKCLGPEKKVWVNIRLSKNGGLGPCRDLAVAAFEANVPFAVGCMVGESSILSAAQRALLASIPRPRFMEGNFGTYLLTDDLTARSLRFGIRGRLKYLGPGGYGVDPDPRRLARYGELVKTLRS